MRFSIKFRLSFRSKAFKQTKISSPAYKLTKTIIHNLKIIVMKDQGKSITDRIKERVKIRLDHKTIITLKDMTRFDYWKNLYPNAIIIS